MALFLVGRMIRLIVTVLFSVTLTFILLRALPGDAVTETLQRSGASEAQIRERRASLGLDRPFLAQYITALGGYLQGDLGIGLISGRPVREMIAEQLPSTIRLALLGAVVGSVFGLFSGVAAVFGSAGMRRLVRVLITSSGTAPVFVTGTILIGVFSVGLRWLPPISPRDDLRSLILPSLVLALSITAPIARAAIGALGETRHQPYLTTARGKGLPERTVVTRHALRNALGVIITAIGLQTGFLLSGTAVTEVLFARPGIGQLVVTAANNRDYPVLQGIVIWSAVVYGLISLITSYLQALTDPRVRANTNPSV